MYQASGDSPLMSLTGLKSDKDTTRINGVGIQKTRMKPGASHISSSSSDFPDSGGITYL